MNGVGTEKKVTINHTRLNFLADAILKGKKAVRIEGRVFNLPNLPLNGSEEGKKAYALKLANNLI